MTASPAFTPFPFALADCLGLACLQLYSSFVIVKSQFEADHKTSLMPNGGGRINGK